jgi:predicted nucleic acid-binding protein
MDSYLLSARVLMNVLLGKNATELKIVDWLAARDADDSLYVSEIAVGHLLSMVRKRGAFSEDEREEWMHLLIQRVPLEFGGRYLRISREVIEDWSRFRYEAAKGDEVLSTVAGLDLAVARSNNLIYVASSTATLCMHYDKIIDPWA